MVEQNAGQEGTYRRPLKMQRGVTQLLFSYLPDRTMDWEDGAAIVQLSGVRLEEVWDDARAKMVLEEVKEFLRRWKRRQGQRTNIDRQFEDLCQGREGFFTVGSPESITANYLPTLLFCRKCSRIHSNKSARSKNAGLLCRRCRQPTLRQFGIIFVHGCGALVAVDDFIPIVSNKDGIHTETQRPLRCQKCGAKSDLALKAPPRSERIKNIEIVCLSCNEVYLDQFAVRCHRCFREYQRTHQNTGSSNDDDSITLITRIKMRATSYRASDAYYPLSLTLLRLDLPEIEHGYDPDINLLRQLLPGSVTAKSRLGFNDSVDTLTEKLRMAAKAGNTQEVARLGGEIQKLAGSHKQSSSESDGNQTNYALLRNDEEWQAELQRVVIESIAFRRTVHTVEAAEVLRQNPNNGQQYIAYQLETLRQLGVKEMLAVEDLPVIVTTFGYTRRSSEPTFEEDRKQMPTRVCAFPPLNEWGLRLVSRLHLKGTIPVLAREGRHEGLFLSLDPERILRWLEVNKAPLPLPGAPPIIRIMHALEPVDRYYDNVERECPVRRYVFGLLHSLSHLVMRVAGRYAGLERTSLSEYLFLPLLGCVVFDNSGSFQLGGLKLLMRDHLLEFLKALDDEAVKCLYDTACIDHKGACHGCIHAPEISCRYFNHGLSRAYLVGGHAPWADVASNKWITGYWEL